jgi:putative CocE/NonD family hydrolase
MSTTIALADGARLLKNVLVPVRDGTRLAADVYLPPDPGPVPVVLEYRPYRKDDEMPPGGRFYAYLLRHGYGVVRVDIRGTGASGGTSTDEYTRQEQEDGYDVVEWIAAQPWCDGHVNMMGTSYSAFTALQVASHAPPHLTSIVPLYFTDDRYTDDCHYRGGLLRMYYDVGHYGNMMIAWNALPPYPEWSGGDWARIWDEHLTGNEPYLLEWLRHQTDGAYWRNGSVGDVADRIRCPVFMIGGWRDGYPNPPLRLYAKLGVPRKLLIGPWMHIRPDIAVPGPRIDYLREVVRWLDHWCRGRDTGLMDEPAIALYVQRGERPVVDRIETAGEWRAESEWPPPGAAERTLFLHDGALADAPGDRGVDTFEYVPTVGVTGGLWSGGVPFGLPGDQRADEAFSLCYDSAPLEEDITVIGRAKALLHVASSASVIGFAVSLADVAPDGSSHLVAKGMLNATRRDSWTDPVPLEPGRVYELAIELDATAWRFVSGHRLRLAIASADFPNVWPTPEPATNEVHRGASRLVLPTVPAAGSAPPPEFAPSPEHIRRQQDEVRPPEWRVATDVLTGRTSQTIRYGSALRIDPTTVIEKESLGVVEVDPANPADASARGRHVARIVRPNHLLETTSDVLIASTATEFHVTIDLGVQVDGAPHFSRRWVESIPRRLL